MSNQTNNGINIGNINGNNNKIGKIEIQDIQRKISDQYQLGDYCSRKKKSLWIENIFAVTAFIADILSIYGVFSPLITLINTFKEKQLISVAPEVQKIQFLSFFVFVFTSCFLAYWIIKIWKLKKQHIYMNECKIGKSRYYIKAKPCPICHSKTKIIFQEGDINFTCTASPKNHSKCIDIKDLQNIPLEE